MQTALILAGGTSRRMGTDKAWLDRLGEPALAYVCRQAFAVCPRVMVSAGADQDLPPLPEDTEVIRDHALQGPLIALFQAIETIESPLIHLSAVDFPVVEPANLRVLFAKIGRADALVPVLEGKRVSLYSALRRDAIERARDRVGDSRRLGRLFEVIRTRELAAEAMIAPTALRSCNTPEEWAAAMDALRR